MATSLLALKNDYTAADTLSSTAWLNPVAENLDRAHRAVAWQGTGVILSSDFTIASVAGELSVDVYPPSAGGGAVVGTPGAHVVFWTNATARVSSLVSNKTNYVFLQTLGTQCEYTNNTSGTVATNAVLLAKAAMGAAQGSSVENTPHGRVNLAAGLPATYWITTTNAIQTTLASIALSDGTSYLIDVQVVARRTGGSSGAAGDSAAFNIAGCFKRTGGGGATLVGDITGYAIADQATWDVVLDGNSNSARIRVTGAANNNVSWLARVTVTPLAT